MNNKDLVRIKKVLAEYALPKPIEVIYAKIESHFSDKIDISNCGLLSYQLGLLSNVESNNFLLSLLNGKEEVIIERASLMADLNFFSIKLKLNGLVEAGSGSNISENKLYMGCLLMFSLGRFDQALWIGLRLIRGDTIEAYKHRTLNGIRPSRLNERSEEDRMRLFTLLSNQNKPLQPTSEVLGQVDWFPVWRDNPLHAFVLRLVMILVDKVDPTIPIEGMPDCGIYEQLFEEWHSLPDIEYGLNQACKFHWRQVGRNSPEVFDFDLPPYRVYPVEVLAYIKVRGLLGLETPVPKHFLMTSPIVNNLPNSVPPTKDETMLRWLDEVKHFIPEFSIQV